MQASFNKYSLAIGETSSVETAPTDLLQAGLVNRVLRNVAGKVWELGCDEIPQCISLRITNIVVVQALNAVQDEGLPIAPKFHRKEKPNYVPVVEFLREAVAAGEQVYDQVRPVLSLAEAKDRWWVKPHICMYDRITSDGIQGAAVHNTNRESHRCMPTSKGVESFSQVENESVGSVFVFPIEDNYQDLLGQIGLHAKACLIASPHRSFVAYFGVNYTEGMFCAFVFYPGGVAVSRPPEFSRGRRPIVKFFLAMFLRQNAEEAGLRSDGLRYLVPSAIPGELDVVYNHVERLHQRTELCGRRTLVSLVEAVGNCVVPGDLSTGSESPSKDVISPCEVNPVMQISSGSTRLRKVTGSQKQDEPDGLSDRRPAKRQRTSLNTESNASGTSRVSGSESVRSVEPLEMQFGSTEYPFSNQPESFQSNGPSNLQPPEAADDQNVSGAPTRLQGRRHQDGEWRTTRLSGNIIASAENLKAMPKRGVFKFSWQPERKCNLEIEVLRECSGRFGLPKFVYAIQLGDNFRFLPTSKADAKPWSEWHNISTKSLDLDRRVRVVTMCEDVGTSLEACSSPWMLGRAFLDCLLGWLGLMQGDFLHRDVSIGNLLLLREPTQREPYAAGLLPDRYNDPRLKHGCNTFRKTSRSLAGILKNLAMDTSCTALLADFDLSTRLDLASTEQECLLGTRAFMSIPLLTAIQRRTNYNQSVSDDLHAFSNVLFWAILFSTTFKGHTVEEDEWRAKLRGHHDSRQAAQAEIVKLFNPPLDSDESDDFYDDSNSEEHMTSEEMIKAKEMRAKIAEEEIKAAEDEARARGMSELLIALHPVLKDWTAVLASRTARPNKPALGLEGGLRQQILAVQSVLSFAEILLRHRGRLEAFT